jgi:hypothetical protein
MIRKFLATIAATAMIFSVQAGAARADAWIPYLVVTPSEIGLYMQENFSNAGGMISNLSYTEQQPNNHFAQHLCSGIGVGQFCQGDVAGTILLPACSAADQYNCIESLGLGTSGGGALAPAKFVRRAGGPVLPADPAHGLTEGSTISLWQSDLKHAGGTGNYAVFASVNVTWSSQTSSLTYNYLTTSVMPFNNGNPIDPVPMVDPRVYEFMGNDGNQHLGYVGGRMECAFVENGNCGRLQDFAVDTKVGLTLRLTKDIGGWFKGRVVDPTIDVKPGTGADASKWQTVSISGSPANVPMFAAKMNRAEASKDVLDMFPPANGGGMAIGILTSEGERSFKAIDLFRQASGDAAAGSSTIWSMGSILGVPSQCLSDTTKVLGIVSTNAMAYEAGAPKFENGQLNYKVGGAHYLADKTTLAEGSYDLIIDSKAARCLYGFTNAPISADISVVSSDGQTKTALTTFQEANGWVKLSARGFTFSNPTVEVKFTQKATPIQAKRTTITCVSVKSAKLTKKVTGTNPKCPSGFKKK